MEFTKAAYGINVEQVEVNPDISLTAKDLEENSNLLTQIPIIYEEETLFKVTSPTARTFSVT